MTTINKVILKNKQIHYKVYENIVTFVPVKRYTITKYGLILTLLPRTNIFKNNTPSMPLHDAHLEGLFFLCV